MSLLFRYMFITDGGLINFVIHDKLHLVGHNVEWLSHRWSALAVISILGIWKGIGWSMVIFLAALQTVPRELKEAAAVDGAKAWARFRAVSLPAILPVIAFVTVMLVIGGFNVFISVFLITNGGPLDRRRCCSPTCIARRSRSSTSATARRSRSSLTLIVFTLSIAQLRLFRRPKDAA